MRALPSGEFGERSRSPFWYSRVVFSKTTFRAPGPCILMGVPMARATPGHHLLAVLSPERRIRNGAFLDEPGGRGGQPLAANNGCWLTPNQLLS